MSFFSKGLDALKKSVGHLSSGAGTVLHFGDVQVVTTALLAEGGYSYVYSAREVGVQARVYAAKKVLAQDAETRDVADKPPISLEPKWRSKSSYDEKCGGIARNR